MPNNMWTQKPPLGIPLNFESKLNDEVVVHLTMNEGHGDRVQDLSLNGNHGTLHGFEYPPTPTSGWNPGNDGVVLNFDGVGDRIHCNHNTSLNITDAITLSCWVKRSSIGSTHTVMMKRGTTGNMSYYLRILSDNKVGFGSYNGSYHRINSTSTITSTTDFYYLTGVFTGTHYQIYINGVLDGETADSTPLPTTTAHLYIGQKGAGYSDHFDGTIDQVRLLSRAYTAKEVFKHYRNPHRVYLEE